MIYPPECGLAPVSRTDVVRRAYLDRVLLPLCEVFPTSRLYAEALSVAEETGWGFYDALIVSSAEMSGCSRLFTEDLQDGRVVRGVEIRNPFARVER